MQRLLQRPYVQRLVGCSDTWLYVADMVTDAVFLSQLASSRYFSEDFYNHESFSGSGWMIIVVVGAFVVQPLGALVVCARKARAVKRMK